VAHCTVADVDDGRDLTDAQFPPCSGEQSNDRVSGVVAERRECRPVPCGVQREVRNVAFERFDAGIDVGGTALTLSVGDEPLESFRLPTHR
jgi:hypothetical protein